jgi:hypothetical protein
MKLALKFIMMFLVAFAFSGCLDGGIEKCDAPNIKETVVKIFMDNGLKYEIEARAEKTVDKEKVAVLVEKELKTARYGLIKANIQEFVDKKNKGCIESNEKIEAENRYSEVKKPLCKPTDGAILLADLEQYKTIIDNFEPINKSDSFEEYFKANVLSKSPLFALELGKKEAFGNMTPLEAYMIYYFNSASGFSGAIRDKKIKIEDKILKELSKKEVENITKTLDIVNIRSISTDEKSKTRQCEANVKLNGQVGSVFQFRVRKLDDGGSRVEVKR